MYCHWLGALVGIAAHFLRINVGFCCTSGRPWLLRFDAPQSGPGSAHVAAHVQIPLTRSLFSFSLAVQRRSSTAAAAPPCPIVCGVNRETENNPRKGKISTSPPPNPLSMRTHLLLSFICGLSALALNLIIFLVNKPVSGRNYTQLGVRSFSVRGPGSFYLKCFLFLPL